MINRFFWSVMPMLFFGSTCVGEELQHGLTHRHLIVGNGSIDAIIIEKNAAANVRVISSISRANAKEFDFPVRAIMTISDYAIATNAIAVLSGGFLSSFSPPTPLGAIIIDGQQISAPHNSWLTTGMFCASKSKRFITEFAPNDQADMDCLQSGPLFIRDNRLRYGGSSSSSPHSKIETAFARTVEEQAFVCNTNDGKLILGVSTPVSFEELGPIVIKELNCTDALGLSGGASVGLYYNGRIDGNDSEPLTSTVAVFTTK